MLVAEFNSFKLEDRVDGKGSVEDLKLIDLHSIAGGLRGLGVCALVRQAQGDDTNETKQQEFWVHRQNNQRARATEAFTCSSSQLQKLYVIPGN